MLKMRIAATNASVGRILPVLAGLLTLISLLPTTGCEMQTNVNPILPSGGATTSVGIAPTSRFVITWFNETDDPTVCLIIYGAGCKQILARVYDQNGNPVTGEIVVAQLSITSGNFDTYIDSAIDNAGDFVIVWGQTAPGTGSLQVYFRQYSPTGASIRTSIAGDGNLADVSMDPVSGNFDISYVTCPFYGCSYGGGRLFLYCHVLLILVVPASSQLTLSTAWLLCTGRTFVCSVRGISLWLIRWMETLMSNVTFMELSNQESLFSTLI